MSHNQWVVLVVEDDPDGQDVVQRILKHHHIAYDAAYDALNTHDDQFDMSESFLTVSIALCGVTALTRRRWLFGLAAVFAISGLVLEIAGFLQWSLHPEWLAKLPASKPGS